jgi:metallothiol transferase
MRVTGFSHVTISVNDLSRSLLFYLDLLEMQLMHRGDSDAYLQWGTAWVCLIEDRAGAAHGSQRIAHIAFHSEEQDFPQAVTRLRQANVPIVRGPIRRGLGWSINFLDPDGAELELHTSTLAERMSVWR